MVIHLLVPAKKVFVNAMMQEKKQLVIFLSESSLDFRESFKENLRKADIEARVLAFNCAEKLMDSLGQSNVFPDVIFITFDQQHEAAKTCLKRIRLKNKFVNVPVIILSPFTYLEDINEAFDNGASLFIPKNVFSNNGPKTLQAIFFRNWQKELLRPNKAKFVLNASAVDENKLTWSST